MWIEQHLTLVAANNLLRAVVYADGRFTDIDQDLRVEIRNQRDLQEHWDEQMAAFYTPASPGPLHRGGAIYAGRHPGGSPFVAVPTWSSMTGPELGDGLPVSRIHSYLDLLEAEVLASAPTLRPYVEQQALSPWVTDERTGEAWLPA